MAPAGAGRSSAQDRLRVAERVSGQVTATHYRVEGVKSGISVALKTMG